MSIEFFFYSLVRKEHFLQFIGGKFNVNTYIEQSKCIFFYCIRAI